MNLSKADRTIETQRGGFLGLYSADNIDSIRGEAFHVAVVDEAGFIPEDAVADVIIPTLADYDGDLVLIGTPKGKNWFWHEWLRGQSGGSDIKSWQAPTSDNPNPNIQRAAKLAKERVSENSYRQEWLAEFLDGGEVFRRVQEAATGTRLPGGIHGSSYVIGVDWGKLNDFTVFVVMDTAKKEMVHIDRFNQIDYQVQLDRLSTLYDKFKPATIIPERNSIGEPLIEQMHRRGMPVMPFQTTNASKATIIDGLALAFEQSTIKILNEPALISELQAYEMERLPSGMMRYNAPSGMHDDCVMALALAWHGCSRSGGRRKRSREY